MPEISYSNRSSKIDLSGGRTKKSATFDPQNPYLKILKSLKIAYQAGFWDRGFWGSNVADVLMLPSNKSNLLDLLLEEISVTWRPPRRCAKIWGR